MTQRLTNLPRWLRDIAPLIFWLSLIFWVSSQSRLVEIGDPTDEKLFFKSAHVVAYGMLAWLWWRALTPDRSTQWSVLGGACILTVLYGISDEFHQTFVPGRYGRIADVLFDTAGALLAILLLRRLAWLRHFPENLL